MDVEQSGVEQIDAPHLTVKRIGAAPDGFETVKEERCVEATLEVLRTAWGEEQAAASDCDEAGGGTGTTTVGEAAQSQDQVDVALEILPQCDRGVRLRPP